MSDNTDENLSKDKIDRLNKKAQDVKDIMNDNIDEVLGRGEDLGTMNSKAGDLVIVAHEGYNIDRKIKNKMFNNYIESTLIALGVAAGGLAATVSGGSVPIVITAMGIGGFLAHALNMAREWVMSFWDSKPSKPMVANNQTDDQADEPGILESFGLDNDKDPALMTQFRSHRRTPGEIKKLRSHQPSRETSRLNTGSMTP